MWLDYSTNDKNTALRDSSDLHQHLRAVVPSNLEYGNTLRNDSLLLRLNCLLLFMGAMLVLSLLFLVGIHQQILSASTTQLEMIGQIASALDDVKKLLKGPPTDPSITEKWIQSTIYEKIQTSDSGTLSSLIPTSTLVSSTDDMTKTTDSITRTWSPSTYYEENQTTNLESLTSMLPSSTHSDNGTQSPDLTVSASSNSPSLDLTSNFDSTSATTILIKPTIPYKRPDPVVILNEVGSRKKLYNCSKLCTDPPIFIGQLLYKNETFIAFGTMEARFAKKSVAFEALKKFHEKDAERVEPDPDNWHTIPPNCNDEYLSTPNPNNLCG